MSLFSDLRGPVISQIRDQIGGKGKAFVNIFRTGSLVSR